MRFIYALVPLRFSLVQLRDKKTCGTGDKWGLSKYVKNIKWFPTKLTYANKGFITNTTKLIFLEDKFLQNSVIKQFRKLKQYFYYYFHDLDTAKKISRIVLAYGKETVLLFWTELFILISCLLIFNHSIKLQLVQLNSVQFWDLIANAQHCFSVYGCKRCYSHTCTYECSSELHRWG